MADLINFSKNDSTLSENEQNNLEHAEIVLSHCLKHLHNTRDDRV